MLQALVFPELAPHTSAAAAGLPQAQEVVVPTSDGEYLVVEGRSRSPAGRRWHRTAGALYRGYEGSTGSPSETGLHLDADAAYAFAAARVPADRIVVWGIHWVLASRNVLSDSACSAPIQ